MQSRGQRTRKRRRGVDQAVPADGGAAEASRRTRSRPGAADAAGGGDAAGAGSSSLLSSVMRGAESLFSGREGTNAQDSAKPTASVGNAWEQAAASQGAGDGGVGMSQLSEADLVDHSLACLGDIQISTPTLRRATSGEGRSRSRRSGTSLQPPAHDGSGQGEGPARLDRTASDAQAASPPQPIRAADIAGALPVMDIIGFESPFPLDWTRTSTADAACGAMAGMARRDLVASPARAPTDASQAAADRGASLRAALGTWVFPPDEMPVSVAREAAKTPDPAAQRAWARQRGTTLAGASGSRAGDGSVPSCMDVRRGKWQGALVHLCSALCAGRALSFCIEFPAVRVVGGSRSGAAGAARRPHLTLSGSTRGLRSRLRAQGVPFYMPLASARTVQAETKVTPEEVKAELEQLRRQNQAVAASAGRAGGPSERDPDSLIVVSGAATVHRLAQLLVSSTDAERRAQAATAVGADVPRIVATAPFPHAAVCLPPVESLEATARGLHGARDDGSRSSLTVQRATFRGPFFPEQVAVAAAVCRRAQERAAADGSSDRGRRPHLLTVTATTSDEYARVREAAARLQRGALHAPAGEGEGEGKGEEDKDGAQGAVLNRALLTADPAGGDAWLLSRERRGL